MAINTNPNEIPTRVIDPKVGGATNRVDFLAIERKSKTVSNLRTGYAVEVCITNWTGPNDRPVSHWVERWGLVCYLPRIDTVRLILDQIGGCL